MPSTKALALFLCTVLIGCGSNSSGSGLGNNNGAGTNVASNTGGGNGGQNPPPAAVNITGDWSFSNGLNANIVQIGSSLSGIAVTFGSNGIIDPCSVLSGTVSMLTVQITASCDVPGESFSSSVNVSGNSISGSVGGFLVPNLTGTYLGTLNFLNNGILVGSSPAILDIFEDQNHNLQATLTLSAQGAISPPPNLVGNVVGGAVDISGGVGGGGISGMVAVNVANISLFVQDAKFCRASGTCSVFATGTVTKQ